MNSVDIFEKSWIDLVFEGKNKAYGAYQLRQQNSRTTILAFLYSLMLLAGAIGIPFVLSAFGTKAIGPMIDEHNTIVHLSDIKPNNPKPHETVTPLKKKVTETNTKQLVDPVIVKPIDADPNIAINKDNKPVDNNPDTGTPGTTVTIPVNTGTGTEIKTTGTGIEKTTSLDKLPEFPGGINRFYSYVGSNFGKTEIGDEKTIKIYVTFVIEKDGSMTDIRVPRDPGFGLGTEAIRVLKSLKTKWAPGMIAGQPVRTAYSLPITVKTE
ncbi:MAG TPA: energy transducer TonB [Flavobacterium sp.]|nr:energy transducer TonB [Flavobacterium sp.]